MGIRSRNSVVGFTPVRCAWWSRARTNSGCPPVAAWQAAQKASSGSSAPQSVRTSCPTSATPSGSTTRVWQFAGRTSSANSGSSRRLSALRVVTAISTGWLSARPTKWTSQRSEG